MDDNPTAPNLAPSEPEAPVAPAESGTPIPPVEPTPQEPVTPMEPIGSVVESQPKKKKTGLIVGVLIMLLLLGGAIACFVIFSDSPEKDAQTASIKFFDTLSAILSPEASTAENKNIKIDGKVNVATKSQYSSQTMNFGANFILEANDKADARALVDLDLKDALTNYYAEPEPMNLEIREINSKNNYFKLSGFSSLLSGLLNSFGGASSELTDVIEQIDGKWLKLDIEELAEKTASISSYSYDKDEEKQSKCLADELAVDKITALIDPNDLAGAFSLVVYEGGDKKDEKGTVYTLEIDAEGTAKLFNNYYKKYQEKIKEVSKKCDLSDSYQSLYSDKEIKAEDLKVYIDKLPKIFVTINNKEITKVSTEYSNESMEISVDLSFSYPDTLEIEEPKDAKSVSEIYEDIYSAIQNGSRKTPLDTKVKACLKELGYTIDTYEDFYANSDAYSAWANSDC